LCALHLAFLYPQIKKLTGAQRLIFELARAVTEAGHRVTLVTHRVHDEPRAAIPAAIRVIETGRRVDRFAQHYADAALEYAFAPALVRHIPSDTDALICFGPPSMPALRWARRRGWGAPSRPLLAFLYEPPRFIDRDRADVIAGLGQKGKVIGPFLGLYRFVDQRLVRTADALLANGDYGATRLRAAYGRPATVLPHGVDFRTPDVEEIQGVRARFGMPDDVPFALTVNQLHPRKRLELFIGAVAAARRAVPELRGLIVGRGVDEARLRAEAARLGVTDAITFVGFVPDADLPTLYAAATLYLHTGRDETLGLSVLEAAWSGTPVVAADEGGPRDILRAGETGWLTPANVPALAEAVAAVLRDPATARERARRARADVRGRFRWEDGARALIAEVTRLRGAR